MHKELCVYLNVLVKGNVLYLGETEVSSCCSARSRAVWEFEAVSLLHQPSCLHSRVCITWTLGTRVNLYREKWGCIRWKLGAADLS